MLPNAFEKQESMKQCNYALMRKKKLNEAVHCLNFKKCSTSWILSWNKNFVEFNTKFASWISVHCKVVT